MSLWKKIFGRNFEESLTEAEDLLKAGRAGEARLELESALSKAKDAPEERITYAREKIVEARRLLAKGHIEDGKGFAESGELDQAMDCYETALEVADDEKTRGEVRKLIDAMEAAEARDLYEETQELTDDERFEIFAGAWEDMHFDELSGYGEPFQDAYIDLRDGKTEEAVSAMTDLVEEHPDALFLRLELGLAQIEGEEFEAATATLKEFLVRFIEEEEALADEWEPPDEDEEAEPEPFAPEARILAHNALSQLHNKLEEYDEAEKELENLIELLPEKAAPYVALGGFLRERGRLEESLETLETGLEFMGSVQPDMRVPLQLGHTLRELGRNQEAIGSLKAVLDARAGLGDFNFPPDAAVPLAEIYEEEGNLQEACDLYRHLADGSHKAGHFEYNHAAARLLLKLGDHDIARRHLTRAKELAPDDETRADLDELFAELEE